MDADNDVLREAQIVESDNSENNKFMVKTKRLQKVYNTGYPAVAGTSFGI